MVAGESTGVFLGRKNCMGVREMVVCGGLVSWPGVESRVAYVLAHNDRTDALVFDAVECYGNV